MKAIPLPDCLDPTALADLREAEALAYQLRTPTASARAEADKLSATIGFISAAMRGNAEWH